MSQSVTQRIIGNLIQFQRLDYVFIFFLSIRSHEASKQVHYFDPLSASILVVGSESVNLFCNVILMIQFSIVEQVLHPPIQRIVQFTVSGSDCILIKYFHFLIVKSALKVCDTITHSCYHQIKSSIMSQPVIIITK